MTKLNLAAANIEPVAVNVEPAAVNIEPAADFEPVAVNAENGYFDGMMDLADLLSRSFFCLKFLLRYLKSVFY